MKMKNFKLLVFLILASVVSFAGCKKNSVAKTYKLNVTATNGTVTKNPDMAVYKSGATVQLTATPNSGYTFTSWSGNVTSSDNPLLIKMEENKNIPANFSADDDTKELQALIDQCPTGGTVSIPAGTYMIDALKHLNLKSNMILRMDSGTVLKAITNNMGNYEIIKIAGIHNVTVVGGTLLGERATHTGSGGEWGFGIGIFSARDVLIDGVTANDCWGDGFYIGGTGVQSVNVTLANVIADNNRRQGLSIVWADSVIVRNSIFKNTRGTPPQAGIDIEPDAGMSVSNVKIINNEFSGNYHIGLSLYKPANVGSSITNVIITGNNLHDNGAIAYFGAAIILDDVSGVLVSGNNVSNNIRGGIIVANGSQGNTIKDNVVINNGNSTDNNDAGIEMMNGAINNTVTGNIVTGNKNKQIIEDFINGNFISGNTVE